jgi:hypothetical protein
MSRGDIGNKFRDCARLVLSPKQTEDAIDWVAGLDRMKSILPLIRVLSGGKSYSDKKKKKRNQGKRTANKKWNGIRKRSLLSSVR